MCGSPTIKGSEIPGLGMITSRPRIGGMREIQTRNRFTAFYGLRPMMRAEFDPSLRRLRGYFGTILFL